MTKRNNIIIFTLFLIPQIIFISEFGGIVKNWLTRGTIFFSIILFSCSDPGTGPEIVNSYPEHFDLRDSSIITSVKDQGDHGTCWAFASCALIESLIKRDLYEEVDLSEQYLINSVEMGPFNAIEHAHNTGVVLESKVPYQGTASDNVSYEGKRDYKIGSYTTLQLNQMNLQTRIDTIKSYIFNNIPVLSHMTLFSDFQNYNGGVYSYDGTSSRGEGHIILIVGWQDDESIPSGGYWIVKNSWGPDWGEQGYFNIEYDAAEFATEYAIVADDPVQIRDYTFLPNTNGAYHTRWSPAGTHIVYTTSDNNGTRIWVHELSTGQNTLLVDNMSGDMTGCWNPGGTKIAFEAIGTNNVHQVFTVDITTKEISELTHGQTQCFQPEWNKVTNKILYFSGNDLYMVNSDGNENHRVTTSGSGYISFAYNWDGTRIVFSRVNSSDFDLYLMNSDFTNETRITTNEARDGRPRFSPDGSKIVFESWRDNPNEEVWIYNISESSFSQITFNPNIGAMPDWSPDGSQLVITGTIDGVSGAWIVQL
jgi:hypothetical protein